MCQLFVGADPELWESQTRSFRVEGMVTSLRLENLFWGVLEDIAARDGVNVPRLVTELYNEFVEEERDTGNFTSFLRVCCLRFINLQLEGLLPLGGGAGPLSAEEILEREADARRKKRATSKVA